MRNRYHFHVAMILIMLTFPLFSQQQMPQARRTSMKMDFRSHTHDNFESERHLEELQSRGLDELRFGDDISRFSPTSPNPNSVLSNHDIRRNSAITYDSNDQIMKMVYEYEDWDGTQWVKYGRETHTYDVNGNETEELEEDWDGTQWININRGTFTYDVNGNCTEYLDEVWDGSLWVNNRRYTDTYDVNGKRTESLREDWNGTQWVNYSRYTYTYDVNGKRNEYLIEEWDGIQWVNDYRRTYTYDVNGKRITSLSENWDGTQWVNYSRYTITYTWFVSTATVAINTPMIPEQYALLPAYPNPFNSETTIQFNLPAAGNVSVMIYDLAGREVTMLVDGFLESGYRQVQWGCTGASGQKLPSGIYIARLVTPEYSMAIKMVLLK